VELLLAVTVGAVLTGAPLVAALWFVVSEAGKGRATAQARAVAQQTYTTELQNRLLAHTWGEFAQLQEVPSHTAQTVTALNSFGEARTEAAYGESQEDIVDAFLRDNGIDLEGPTVG
jgi:hypothetical protein